MFRCHVCAGTKACTEIVCEIFRVDGKHVLVENIPALICERCGEATFSKETTETVRKMVRGKTGPQKSVMLDVFEFSL